VGALTTSTFILVGHHHPCLPPQAGEGAHRRCGMQSCTAWNIRPSSMSSSTWHRGATHV